MYNDIQLSYLIRFNVLTCNGTVQFTIHAQGVFILNGYELNDNGYDIPGIFGLSATLIEILRLCEQCKCCFPIYSPSHALSP